MIVFMLLTVIELVEYFGGKIVDSFMELDVHFQLIII